MGNIGFSEKLQQLRNNMGWSQGELATRLNVATSTVSMYERGQREPNINMLNKIASVFNVSVNDITEEASSQTLSNEHLLDSKNSDYSLVVTRNRGSGRKQEVIKLRFRGSQPILSINGTELEFSLTYMDLQPEDKIAVCKVMLERAKDELLRG
jgi:transcriptional regulator with XRE-family HTH domain